LGPRNLCVVISGGLKSAQAFENVVGDVGTSFLHQQPPPVTYNAPRYTAQAQHHQFVLNYAEGSDQRRLQNPRMVNGSHPSRSVSMQPFYTTANQHVQGNTMPQHDARTPYNQLNSHGIRLRPVSDLRMPSSRHQHSVLMSLPR